MEDREEEEDEDEEDEDLLDAEGSTEAPEPKQAKLANGSIPEENESGGTDSGQESAGEARLLRSSTYSDRTESKTYGSVTHKCEVSVGLLSLWKEHIHTHVCKTHMAVPWNPFLHIHLFHLHPNTLLRRFLGNMQSCWSLSSSLAACLHCFFCDSQFEVTP